MPHHPHHRDPAQRRSFRVIQAMRVFWVSCLLLGMALLPISMSAQDGPTQIVVGQIDGTITPVMARYVDRVIRDAERDGAAAVVFEMDTPGGLSSAMDDIIRDILESDVPVVVYVAPRGARAASAGVYISYAAHVAAMAPGTNIGSASPVFMGSDGSTTDGEDTMTKKVTNDAVAQIVNLANLRGRNAEWAEEAVREAVNITADQALELNVIDLMAPDFETLLTEIDGVQVETAVGPATLETAGATTRQVEMTVIEEFMQLIADPTIAYLLLSLGMLGIFLELSNPGAMLPGIVGGLGVLLGLFALGTVPVNWAGVLLMVLAFGLFLADLFIPSGGLLTLGGLASFVIGSFLLVDPSAPPGYEISPTAIWTMTFAFVVFFGTIGYLVLRARRKKSVTGKEGMIGEIATVRQTLRPEGMVFVHGELWSAVLDPDAQGSVIRDGEHVVVSGIQGLRLAVRPIEQETGQQERSRLGRDPFLAAEGSRP
jgi:membrane-bound serine protease (ClpP class)